jgi:tetratricopeptide (TPR) repeat protein
MENVLTRWWATLSVAVCLGLAIACSRTDPTPVLNRAKQLADAQQPQAAAAAYDEALRIDPGNTRAHLELGLLLDDALGDPVGAIYHYRRFLELEPNSDKQQLVKDFIERAQLSLAAKLPRAGTGDTAELQRLQTERAALMQENSLLKARLTELEAASHPVFAPPATVAAEPPAMIMAAAPVPAAPEPVVATPAAPVASGRMHVVQAGDTLYSLALRYYGTRADWVKIFDANRSVLESKDRLKIGQRLVIP